jgi:DNA mismatch repair protein MutS
MSAVLAQVLENPAPISALFEVDPGGVVESAAEPDFFGDLNLDQIVASVTEGRDDYQLKPYFYVPLESPETIAYRQAVFRDLERQGLAGHLAAFGREMKSLRDSLVESEKRWYPRQKQRGLLEAVDSYSSTVTLLARDLQGATLSSEGLRRVRDYVLTYRNSELFRGLVDQTRTLRAELSKVEYRLQIEGLRITVSGYAPEADYGAVITRTFEKFRQGAPRDYRFRSSHADSMSHVDAAILDRVAALYPQVFTALENYYAQRRDFLDPTLARFDREIQFYLGYLEHLAALKRARLSFCYPELNTASAGIECHGAFDMALAGKLAKGTAAPITNDVSLSGQERVLVVTGANQGGKTTFARMVGQLHYLARLGCPVPGTAAKLILFDRLFAHFEREEDLRTLRSKLEDDLARIRAILERATSRSLLVMNESFSSATFRDALYLSKEILGRIIDRGTACVFVTFLDELSSLGPSTVSLVATVNPEDPAQRTFKVVRRPADGLAHAIAIAEKHGLSYERIKQRLTA